MMADPEGQPDELALTPEQIAEEIAAAGIVPTRLNLQNLIADARAAHDNKIEVDRRHLPHPLLALTPLGMSEDTPRKWAGRTLDAWRVKGRLYSCIDAMESWLIATDRLSAAALVAWRKDMKRRFP